MDAGPDKVRTDGPLSDNRALLLSHSSEHRGRKDAPMQDAHCVEITIRRLGYWGCSGLAAYLGRHENIIDRKAPWTSGTSPAGTCIARRWSCPACRATS